MENWIPHCDTKKIEKKNEIKCTKIYKFNPTYSIHFVLQINKPTERKRAFPKFNVCMLYVYNPFLGKHANAYTSFKQINLKNEKFTTTAATATTKKVLKQ